jgi:hypothetical protein
MVTDIMGNELKEGDLVALQLERPLIFGRIAEVAEGGIITGLRGGQSEMRPTRVMVICHHPIEVDPRQPKIGAMIKLYDPAGIAEKLEEAKAVAPN